MNGMINMNLPIVTKPLPPSDTTNQFLVKEWKMDTHAWRKSNNITSKKHIVQKVKKVREIWIITLADFL